MGTLVPHIFVGAGIMAVDGGTFRCHGVDGLAAALLLFKEA